MIIQSGMIIMNMSQLMENSSLDAFKDKFLHMSKNALSPPALRAMCIEQDVNAITC